ncbi:(-)-germacrene D synthase-like isoform X2 [Macadamia integrifolia]|uniref:(-)-germacrene D synthase-like isoform X2 n=1 Tax=Macadamia integrifolia TaxID=60698 RepID=UPI001C529481|nr:(-)-germacrene D synthase-like isoform X2 [Macadamia integrifolia]
MSSLLSCAPVAHQYLVQNSKTDIVRRSANYHPSIWGDQFLKYAPPAMVYEACPEHVEELKEVRRILMADANDPSKKLNLIDSLQRLGVAYHFEEEMEELLEKMHDALPVDGLDGCSHLYTIALWFRLLRQQGYNVSSNVFNRFKDSKGSFNEELIKDVPGMLCLYEATFLKVHEEDILDEALTFTTTQLKSIVTDLKPPLATQVIHALKQPLHKGMPRLEARHYITVYQEFKTKNETLLKLAKLDFNSLQLIHRQELSQLSRWWKDLDFATKLPYARDRLVECYFWIVGVYFETHYSLARMILTKVITMTSIIDDTYDVYGTLEELKLFTDAIDRWDISGMEQLPEYMKVLYSALLDVYNEIKQNLIKKGQSYRVNYAIEAVEQARGDVCSSVECYMKQHRVTEQEACDELHRRVEKAWKDINEECIKPSRSPVPLMPFLMQIVNFTRMMDVIYKHDDGYSNAAQVLKEYITFLFIDPI